MPDKSGDNEAVSSRRQYVLNIFWSWVGAVALIVSGLLVSPYLIRRLGSEQYGIWVLGLSMVEYFWMIDLGVRPATVKLAAEYRAKDEWEQLNSLLSTAGAYSLAMGLLIVVGLWAGTGPITRFFKIEHPDFPLLLRVVSLSWGFGLVFNVFGAAIEGFQRFDITNRIMIGVSVVRSLVMVALVNFGYGLREMSLALLVLQLSMYVGFYAGFRALYPGMQLGAGCVNRQMGLEIWRYGRQMIGGIVSMRLLQSAIPSIIARQMPVQNITYYSVTQKMLEYGSEGIGRIGLITAPRATDWMARGMKEQVIRMAEYANRYCLAFWMAACSFLWVYGEAVLRLWVNDEFAAHSAPVLRVMLIGQALWPGQFISASVLTGIGRYAAYSNALLVEAVLTVACFGIGLKLYGLPGGAAVAGLMMVLNRCVYLSWLFAREMKIGWGGYVWRIYRWPGLIGITGTLALWQLQRMGWSAASWRELIGIGCVYMVFYLSAVVALVLERDHRRQIVEMVAKRWPLRLAAK